uniref:hypothetical protein n=1 Tax=Hassallia byssoidea TaxID=482630 RepID=UPI0013D40674|nr:hypothetical protein [Hassalia byssoidea]
MFIRSLLIIHEKVAIAFSASVRLEVKKANIREHSACDKPMMTKFLEMTKELKPNHN